MLCNKVKLLGVFLLVIGFHVSCQDRKNVLDGKIVVSFENVTSLENIESLYRVRLDENSITFPGMVHKMACLNDTIYVLDVQKAPGLYVYDGDGTLLYAYDCVGEGPWEFNSLIDFQVIDASIYLLDNAGRKVLELDKSGKCIASEPIPELAYSFVNGDNGITYFDTGNSTAFNNSKLISVEGENTSTILTVPNAIENITISPTNTLVYNHGSVFYLPALENVIHECKDGQVVKTFEFDFGDYWPDESFWNENKGRHPLMLFRSMEESSYIRELNFLMDDEIIHLNFMQGNSFFLFFYNMKSGKHNLYIDKNKDFHRPCALSQGKLYVMQEDETFDISVYKLNLQTLRFE